MSDCCREMLLSHSEQQSFSAAYGREEFGPVLGSNRKMYVEMRFYSTSVEMVFFLKPQLASVNSVHPPICCPSARAKPGVISKLIGPELTRVQKHFTAFRSSVFFSQLPNAALWEGGESYRFSHTQNF